jgi:hypothetical protein
MFALALAVIAMLAPGQTGSPAHFDKNSSASILDQLAPADAYPSSLRLKPSERANAIHELLVVKRDETGWHRELADYLLATLGHDFEANRDALLRVWRGDGDDDTTGLLIQLYGQGHKGLLQPLLARFDG